MRIICIIPKQKASLEESYGWNAFCYSPANDQKTIIKVLLLKTGMAEDEPLIVCQYIPHHYITLHDSPS